MTDVSIIVPCYNHGQFIHETIQSVLNQSYTNFECIVVNDGSTDKETISILKSINHPKIKVLHTENQGLASARNNGIKQAQAEIILPLDSDDLIAPDSLTTFLEVIKKNQDIGIVYGLTNYFGEKKGRYTLPDYSLNKLLFGNLITHCAFYWRKDWELVGGYNSNMLYGYEDWDFWLSIVALGKRVVRIPEVLHIYRVRNGSMVRSMTTDKIAKMRAQIFLNHESLYKQNLPVFFMELQKIELKADGFLLDRLINEKLAHPFKTAGNLFSRFINNQ